MSAPTNAERLAAIQATASAAADAWLAKAEASGAIESRVRDSLDKRAESVVMMLLGFDREWGGSAWKLDHCNGRAGNSAAGDWIRERAADAIRAWLEDQAGKLPPLSKTTVNRMRDHYTETLERELRRALTKRAEADAAAMVAAIVANEADGAA
jgi:hypothetical protein